MTPNEIADYMIDDILKLTSQEILNFTFLDNSCGNGVFIKGLLRRGVPREHIWACDIDGAISSEVKSLLPENNFRIGSFFFTKRLDQ